MSETESQRDSIADQATDSPFLMSGADFADFDVRQEYVWLKLREAYFDLTKDIEKYNVTPAADGPDGAYYVYDALKEETYSVVGIDGDNGFYTWDCTCGNPYCEHQAAVLSHVRDDSEEFEIEDEFPNRPESYQSSEGSGDEFSFPPRPQQA